MNINNDVLPTLYQHNDYVDLKMIIYQHNYPGYQHIGYNRSLFTMKLPPLQESWWLSLQLGTRHVSTSSPNLFRAK